MVAAIPWNKGALRARMEGFGKRCLKKGFSGREKPGGI